MRGDRTRVHEPATLPINFSFFSSSDIFDFIQTDLSKLSDQIHSRLRENLLRKIRRKDWEEQA